VAYWHTPYQLIAFINICMATFPKRFLSKIFRKAKIDPNTKLQKAKLRLTKNCSEQQNFKETFSKNLMR
jgi:hypothetical protein